MARCLWRWRAVGWCVVLCGSTLSAPASSAGLFRCVDHNGQSVFTDRPAQMTDCRPLVVESSPSPAPPTVSAPVLLPPAVEPAMAPPTPRSDGPVPVDSGIAVPVRKIGHLYVVPVEVNGTRTAQLILDTGASHTILSRELVRDLALPSSDFQPGLVTLKTAGGAVDAQLVRIDSMKIAAAEVRRSLAAVHTVPDVPSGVDGLLGLSFLRQFEVTLDTMKGELRLRPTQK
jgi:clan AA aspartic protease (TIGR02281 family)